MTDKAACLGTFSDFRLIKSRKLCQIIVEIPIEQANAALQALGGIPDSANPPWVGIARVQPKAASEPLKAVERPRKTWAELTPAQQAGIRCQEQEFVEFLAEEFGDEIGDPADYVRKYCGVESRSLIFKGSQAAQRWNLLESAYQAHLSERQYAEVIR
jgi:hypothetical protein